MAACQLLRDAEITMGAAFTMQTTNRTARSVKCRPSSAGAGNARSSVLQTGPRALRVGARETGAICRSPSPGADISDGGESIPVEADHGRWRPDRQTDLPR
jgi:hypothetical protein